MAAVLGLAACGGSVRNTGGYLLGDGTPKYKIDSASVQNTVPKVEPKSATGNRLYTVFGKQYQPLDPSIGYREVGIASWYGTKFHGRRTSSGEPYDMYMYAMSAAHRTLPLPSYVKVTNLNNKRRVIVKVNDRGPFIDSALRIIDLSYVALPSWPL